MTRRKVPKPVREEANAILALVDAEYRPGGWVSVKERPPVVERADDGSVNCILIYAKGQFECGSDIQIWNAVYCRLHPEMYTHWRPLPEPPKEEP
jgi:hypothetical protein